MWIGYRGGVSHRQKKRHTDVVLACDNYPKCPHFRYYKKDSIEEVKNEK